MRWRRVCVDVTDGGDVLGASVEFYDDFERGAHHIGVASEGEVKGKSPVAAFGHVYEVMRWQQLQLWFDDPNEEAPLPF